MKKVFLLSLCIFIASCQHSPQATKDSPTTKIGDFTIKIIDECEYIEYSAGMSETSVYSITHKGNCKFCAKRNGKITL